MTSNDWSKQNFHKAFWPLNFKASETIWVLVAHINRSTPGGKQQETPTGERPIIFC